MEGRGGDGRGGKEEVTAAGGRSQQEERTHPGVGGTTKDAEKRGGGGRGEEGEDEGRAVLEGRFPFPLSRISPVSKSQYLTR